jgi:hypothetical protein
MMDGNPSSGFCRRRNARSRRDRAWLSYHETVWRACGRMTSYEALWPCEQDVKDMNKVRFKVVIKIEFVNSFLMTTSSVGIISFTDWMSATRSAIEKPSRSLNSIEE